MHDKISTLQDCKDIVSAFRKERNWDTYHVAKNLAANIVVEAAELLEIFTWLTEQQAEDTMKSNCQEVHDEIGDIFFALLSLCTRYNIDLAHVFIDKLARTAKKYPVELEHDKQT